MIQPAGPFVLGPTNLGCRYQGISLLAEGGMGAVYRGHCLTDGNPPVAIKLALATTLPPNDNARFKREIAAVAGLNHPNIVKTLDHGQDARFGPFIVMELLQGETLEDLLGRQPYGRLSPERTAEIALPVCGALFYAHSLATPLMHRDIKPANIFLSQNQRPFGKPVIKVMDFGLARDPDAETHGLGARQKLTEAGIALGTLQYISPEQCRGKPGLASDVYALGILLYLMLEGRFPFADHIAAPEDLVAWHLHGVPREMSSGVPPHFKDLIPRMLAKEPKRRPSLCEIQDALCGIGGNIPGATVRIPTVEPIPNLILPADAMTIRASSPRFVEEASPMEVIDDDVYFSRPLPPPANVVSGEISGPSNKVIVERPSFHLSFSWLLRKLARRWSS